MRRTGDGEVRRCNVSCFDPILGHLVQVWGVHIPIVIPPETVERNEQQLLLFFAHWSAEDAGGPEEAEARGPQHDNEHLAGLT